MPLRACEPTRRQNLSHAEKLPLTGTAAHHTTELSHSGFVNSRKSRQLSSERRIGATVEAEVKTVACAHGGNLYDFAKQKQTLQISLLIAQEENER